MFYCEWQFWIALISAIVTIITVIIAVCTYVKKQRQQEFEDYHKLIERINGPLNNEKAPFLQVQQAAIFELRNYKRYKKLTIKLLEHWKKNEKYKEFVDDTLYCLKNKFVKIK